MVAAVRAFFASGGRTAYVVRVGDPPATGENAATSLSRLLPGYPHRLRVSPQDRASWRGFGAVAGQDDLSFVLLPDLPSLLAVEPVDPPPVVRPAPPPERFVVCSQPTPPPDPENALLRLEPPRLDETGYRAWSRALALAAGYLAMHGREMLLVASLPLPTADLAADLHGHLASTGILDVALEPGSDAASAEAGGLSSAFVQLVFPWLRTARAGDQPGGIEAPEGLFAGLLAHNALSHGTFRSAAGLGKARALDELGVLALEPRLERAQSRGERLGYLFSERISLIEPRPSGFALVSDVTTSLDRGHRPAAISRLMAVVVRAARRVGENYLFEPSGPALWARIRSAMERLLLRLYRAGALRGRRPRDAYEVRCDRTTMAQADLDNGRVIVEVRLAPAAPVEQITVVLSLGRAPLGATEAVA